MVVFLAPSEGCSIGCIGEALRSGPKMLISKSFDPLYMWAIFLFVMFCIFSFLFQKILPCVLAFFHSCILAFLHSCILALPLWLLAF